MLGIAYNAELIRAILANLQPEHVKDSKFTIVYVSREWFEDGYIAVNICYRIGVPGWTPHVQQQTGVTETQTLIEQIDDFDALAAT